MPGRWGLRLPRMLGCVLPPFLLWGQGASETAQPSFQGAPGSVGGGLGGGEHRWWTSRRQNVQQLEFGDRHLAGAQRNPSWGCCPATAPPPPCAPLFHGHLEIQPTTAGARSSSLPSCSLTSNTPAHSLGGARAELFWLEVGEGCRERGRISSPYTRHCPPGQPGTESLNNSPNVNNLKIFLFNCFPCPAWGRLCRAARGRGRRPPGSSAASWAVNQGRAPPPPLRSRL